MHYRPPRLQPADLATARAVVLDPVRFAADPDARLNAWAALKLARGEQVNPLRLHLLQRCYQHPANLPVRMLRANIPDAPFFDGQSIDGMAAS